LSELRTASRDLAGTAGVSPANALQARCFCRV